MRETKGLDEEGMAISNDPIEDELFYSPVNKDWHEMHHETDVVECEKAGAPENTAVELNSVVSAEPESRLKAKLDNIKGDEYSADLVACNESPLDYYDLLGLSTSATTAEIVAAYRHRAREVADLSTSDPLYINIKKVKTRQLIIRIDVYYKYHDICSLPSLS